MDMALDALLTLACTGQGLCHKRVTHKIERTMVDPVQGLMLYLSGECVIHMCMHMCTIMCRLMTGHWEPLRGAFWVLPYKPPHNSPG
jgi:hypothetical protein